MLARLSGSTRLSIGYQSGRPMAITANTSLIKPASTCYRVRRTVIRFCVDILKISLQVMAGLDFAAMGKNARPPERLLSLSRCRLGYFS
jgi:hypothetical protein